MSRSILTRASSARSRLISICSALTTLLSAPVSLPARCALTQLNSVWSTTPNVRAAAAMLWPPSTRRTPSCLNSSVYRALGVVFVISVLLAWIESLSKGYVFRGQGHTQQAQVFRWINGKDPRQYGLDFGLWTRQITATLIEQKFGVTLGVTAVGRLLARLGLTPQKPLQRAYQRDPQAIERWQRETYPGIAAAARQSGADVYFWDESGFRADTVHGKTWAPKGKTPVIQRPGQRQSISAASAVNAKGGFWFATYQGALNAELFIALLKKMMKGRSKPVHLVVDGLPAHKKLNVREYIASTQGKLTMHVLPGYAPDLNPDELVWSHVKRTGVARNPLRAGEKLDLRIEQQLHDVQRNRRLVRSFFGTPSVAYISDC